MCRLLIMGEALVEIMRDKAGVPLGQVGLFRGPFSSGAPAICADAAARLGCKTALISGVGDDAFGKCITDRLRKDGVDISHVLVDPQVSTGCAFVTYYEDGSREFIFHMGNTPAAEAKAPSEEDFPNVEIMHIMGCSLMAKKEFAGEIVKTMHMFYDKGAKISFDPNIRKELLADESTYTLIEDVMNHVSIFLPGREELLFLTGKRTVPEAIEKAFAYPRMEMVLLKNGSRGSSLYLKNGQQMEFDAYPIEQVDATGAGDCFDGAFLAGLIGGESPEYSAKMASAAGALNAAAFGPMEGDIRPETVKRMIQK